MGISTIAMLYSIHFSTWDLLFGYNYNTQVITNLYSVLWITVFKIQKNQFT